MRKFQGNCDYTEEVFLISKGKTTQQFNKIKAI